MKYFKIDDDTNEVLEVDRQEWRVTTEKRDPVIARTRVRGVFVETFFRGSDASSDGSEPHLWRTRVKAVGTENWPKQRRYRTRVDAYAGHIAFCKALEELSDEEFTAGLGDADGR